MGGEPLYHLTLRFLGDVLPDTLERLLSLDALNSPRLADSNAVWIGVGGQDVGDMVALQDEVERLAVERRLSPADHPFTPHITIRRFRPVERAAGPKLAATAAGAFKARPLPWTASHVHLMESTRVSGMVTYSSISTAPLRRP